MFYDCEQKDLKVHIFKDDSYEGEVKETEEMAPKWFDTDTLPFESMWKDDPYWMPYLLKGDYFYGTLRFKDHETLLDIDIKPVSEAELVEL